MRNSRATVLCLLLTLTPFARVAPPFISHVHCRISNARSDEFRKELSLAHVKQSVDGESSCSCCQRFADHTFCPHPTLFVW
jgi:hypothetical protein